MRRRSSSPMKYYANSDCGFRLGRVDESNTLRRRRLCLNGPKLYHELPGPSSQSDRLGSPSCDGELAMESLDGKTRESIAEHLSNIDLLAPACNAAYHGAKVSEECQGQASSAHPRSKQRAGAIRRGWSEVYRGHQTALAYRRFCSAGKRLYSPRHAG